MLKENKNFKIEREAFLLRCRYEKELHSNKNSLQTLGFIAILMFGALASQEKQMVISSNPVKPSQKEPVPVSSQRTDSLYVTKGNNNDIHSR